MTTIILYCLLWVASQLDLVYIYPTYICTACSTGIQSNRWKFEFFFVTPPCTRYRHCRRFLFEKSLVVGHCTDGGSCFVIRESIQMNDNASFVDLVRFLFHMKEEAIQIHVTYIYRYICVIYVESI
jgi:hypothetical protein